MSQSITDFTDEQLNAVQALLNKRYGEEIEMILGDSEMQVDSNEKALAVCPVIFWNARECNFVIAKTGEDVYQAQYFYTPHEQMGTRQAYFTAVEDCANAVLGEQSDYERESAGATRGATGADIS